MKLKAPLVPGESYHGVLVLRRLSARSTPGEWATARGKTLLVSCSRCGEDTKALESHVRQGTFRHKWGRQRCTPSDDLDLCELLEDLEADGDLA